MIDRCSKTTTPVKLQYIIIKILVQKEGDVVVQWLALWSHTAA